MPDKSLTSNKFYFSTVEDETNYSKRFRTAYGPHRLGAESPHRSSNTKSPIPRAERHRDGQFPLTDTSVTGRRRRAFVDSVERANLCPVTARTMDASGAGFPYMMKRCELAPTTAVRASAQAKYSKRFRAPYGHARSRATPPHRTSGDCIESYPNPDSGART